MQREGDTRLSDPATPRSGQEDTLAEQFNTGRASNTDAGPARPVRRASGPAPLAGPEWLPRRLRAWLARRGHNRSPGARRRWPELLAGAAALLALLLLGDALTTFSLQSRPERLPATFDDLLAREAPYLPERTAAQIRAECTELPPMLLRAYTLEAQARRGAAVPPPWDAYFGARDWYGADRGAGAPAPERADIERRRLAALHVCTTRRGL